MKKEDWLKKVADNIISRVSKGEFGTVHTSREVLHELYYVSKEEGVTIDQYISRAAALTAIDIPTFTDTTYEIDLLALTLMKQYKIESIFDAYYAATTLNQVPDRIIMSTDEIFDAIPGMKGIDPHDYRMHHASLSSKNRESARKLGKGETPLLMQGSSFIPGSMDKPKKHLTW